MAMILFFQLTATFLIPLLIVLIPILIGQRYGIYHKQKKTALPEVPVKSAVGAALSLLAFMLALTFQIAAARYGARKQLLLEEVTNIRTTYLRAGLVPEPIHSATRKLLVEYVDLRVELVENASRPGDPMSHSQQILDSLWNYTETLAAQDRSSEVYSLFTSSVNDLVDNYNQRVTTALEYRIPPAILWVLFIIAFLSMLVLGYQFGISGQASFGINLLLAFIFAAVMVLILVLDSPEAGIARVHQKPMFTLQQQLHAKQSNEENKHQ